ncbi:MAG: AP2/ERF family transcription factor [Rhodocyclaceae bacterium]
MEQHTRPITPAAHTQPRTPAHTDPKPYGISPYLDKGHEQRGWKLNIRRRGVLFYRSFNARDFGGLDGALQAALAVREEIIRDHPLMSKREWCATLRTTNTSGVPGVQRVRDRTGEHWKAKVNFPDGHQKTRQFSINKYGGDGAHRLAIEARRKLLALVEGTVAMHHPDVPEPDHDDPAIPHFDQVVRVAADDLGPNPLAPPVACEVVGVHLTHIKDKKPSPDGSFRVTPYWTATMELSTESDRSRPLRRYFSVLRYGDEEARRLAIAQRHAWEAQQARGEAYTVQRGGTSGVKGVVRGPDAWLARVRLPNGRVKTRSFAIRKHGDEEARRLAAAQHQTWEAQLARGEPVSTAWASESGVPGIVRSGPNWQVNVVLPDGRLKTRSFAFSRYGQADALQRAIEAQKELIETYRADDKSDQAHP